MKKFLISLLVLAMIFVPVSILASAEESTENDDVVCLCADDCVQCRLYAFMQTDMAAQCNCIKIPTQLNDVLNDLINNIIKSIRELIDEIATSIAGPSFDIGILFPTTTEPTVEDTTEPGTTDVPTTE